MLQIQDARTVLFSTPLPQWGSDGVMAVVPYVDEAGIHLLGRAYKKSDSQSVYRSCLFVADGNDPFTFTMRPNPILEPDNTIIACEDPTRVVSPSYGPGFMYSQVRRIWPKGREGRGGSAEDLGVYVALGCVFAAGDHKMAIRTILEPTQQVWWHKSIDMCKEGEVLVLPEEECDLLFYEFCDDTASRIAHAKVDFCGRGRQILPFSAWDSQLWIDTRPGMWDGDHVSTGPIIDYKGKKLMFYNGCRDKTWAIGEIVFDPITLEIEYRSSTPVIIPPQEIGWQDQYIAFSSGVAIWDNLVHLYYHVADQRVECAIGVLE